MSTLKKIVLDARELEHPKPLELAMKALRELSDENYFYMIHRKNPIPLLDLATEQKFSVYNQEDENGEWHILISKLSNVDLSELIVTNPVGE
jgi:TusA-related sulfurtransferase